MVLEDAKLKTKIGEAFSSPAYFFCNNDSSPFLIGCFNNLSIN